MENIFLASSAYTDLGLKRLSVEFPGEVFQRATTEEFACDFRSFVKRYRRYDKAVFYTYDFEMARTILWHAIVWWIARRGLLIDESGRRKRASLTSFILRDSPQLFFEPVLLPGVFSCVMRDLSFLERRVRPHYPPELSIAYLRTDHWFGIKSGGSVTHIAGVANAFRDLGIPLFFLSSDRLELIDTTRTPLHWIKPGKYIQNMPDAPQLAYNLKFIREADKLFHKHPPTLLYQRYSQYNYAGAFLAAKWNLPFVLEYNGSEVWMARNWGTPLRFQRWAEEIERINLQSADAIVVVSEPMRHELESRGVDPKKILVNPNGVDTDRFDAAKLTEDRARVRERYKLEDKTVVGFIGTFGRWHGAEVLAHSVADVVTHNRNVHFFFIGDGVTQKAAMEIVDNSGTASYVTFTGRVQQEQGPAYLSACDILASPHVPNPDGSPFFGSPTKLFEYMSMGRGIVASNLDQIGEILTHRETALLVRPGSVVELSEAILELAKDPGGALRLGTNARSKVLAEHTWRKHAQQILEHLSHVLN